VKVLVNQFLRFAAFGAVATAAHYAVMLTLVEIAGVHPVLATICGSCAGAVVSYTLNRRYTFDARPAFGSGLVKFLVVILIGAGINAGIVWLLMRQGLYYMLAQVIATGIVLIWNFASARLVVFRAPPSDA
jgi:putative flippase GtrA